MPAPVAAWAARRTAASVKKTGARRAAAAAAGTTLLAVALPMTAIIVAVGGTRDPATIPAATGGVVDIPPEPLAAYRDAGERWTVDWAILAGIGKVECDHGRAQLPGCNPPETMNSAGARGYMQFIGSTWRRGLGQHELEPRSSPPAADGAGYATDGDGDGEADPWSWLDAAHSAARLLAANGISDDPRGAVWAYNHDDQYVEAVLQHAEAYRAAAGVSGAGSGSLVTVGGITVDVQIADRVSALLSAAEADGLELGGGGWRSAEDQIALRRAHCGSSDYAIYDIPASQCSPPTARPGESMHEQGLAIDFTCSGSLISVRSNACYRWLSSNASAYGLHELSSGAEPWHWSTDGT